MIIIAASQYSLFFSTNLLIVLNTFNIIKSSLFFELLFLSFDSYYDIKSRKEKIGTIFTAFLAILTFEVSKMSMIWENDVGGL